MFSKIISSIITIGSNILLGLTMLLITFFAVDFFAEHFTVLKKIPEKIFLLPLRATGVPQSARHQAIAYELGKKSEEFKQYHLAHCYTSPPRYTNPITIVDPTSEAKLYCLTYNPTKRRKGFFPERKKHIVIVGDSFTFGEGVEDHNTLGYLLAQQYPDINVRNISWPGMNIGAVHNNIAKTIQSDHEVKEIIYFYNLNDVLQGDAVCPPQNNIIDLQNIRYRNAPIYSGNAPQPSYTICAKLWHESVFGILLTRLNLRRTQTRLTIANYNDMYTASINKDELQKTIAFFRQMRDITQQHNIPFQVVIYPLLYKNSLAQYPFVGIHSFLAEQLKTLGIPCLDGYNAFKGSWSLKKFTVHQVDFHPNGRANQRLIKYIKKQHFLNY